MINDIVNGIIHIVDFCGHDFFRLIASVIILRALFSFRLVQCTSNTKVSDLIKQVKNND